MTERTITSNPKSTGFLSELRRRRVLPVAGAYIAIAWLVTEIAGFFLEQAGAPAWSLRLLAIVFMVGFPIAVVLAWVVQVGPDGKRTLDSSKGLHKTVLGAVLLGIVATAGLAWLILPRIEDIQVTPGYDPLPNSVAILPFVSPDATPHEATIGETVHAALTTGLNASGDLTQVTLRLKDVPADLMALGRSVRVASLLTGKVQRSGGATKIELSLLDVTTQTPHWTRSFDWNSARIGEIGTEISNGLLETLGHEPISTKRFAGTDNQEAYEAFLLGRRASYRFRAGELRQAIAHYQRAIDLDPDYLRAHVSLAAAIGSQINFGKVGSDQLDALKARQQQAMETARDLDSDSPDVISYFGSQLMFKDTAMAIQTFQRALELDPEHEVTLLRYAILLNVGLAGFTDREKAEELYRRLIELDPMNANSHVELAKNLRRQGRPGEARAELRKAIEYDPEMPETYSVMANWEIADTGRYDKAHLLLHKAYTYDPNNISNIGAIAFNYAKLGAREEALEWLDKIIALNPNSRFTFRTAWFVHVALGNLEEAFGYVRQFHDLYPDDVRNFHFTLLVDVHTGKARQALDRARVDYPGFNDLDGLEINAENIWRITEYSWILIEAGEEETAKPLLERALDYLRTACGQGEEPGVTEYPCDHKYIVHALLGQKEQVLAELQRMIEVEQIRFMMDGFFRIDRFPFDGLGSLRDDPEIKRLMKIVDDHFAAQLESLRQMQKDGEAL